MEHYKYRIWTVNEKGEAVPWVDCYTLTSVANYLNLTTNQVKERMTWNGGVLDINAWHVQHGCFKYQITKLKWEK